jgi:predicted Zn-dependent peptidase
MPHYKVQDVFSSVLYGDQPAGWNVAGTRETVRSMTRDHFIAYRKKNYVASATTVFISGNFNEKQVISEVSRLFAGIAVAKKQSKKKVIETQVKPNMGICKRETDQTHIVLGVKTYPAKSEKNYALQVLSTILGGGMSSRLFQKLREEMGVGYYVRSSVSQQTDCGVLAVSTGVDKGRVDEVISAVLSEMKKLRDEMVSVEEMKKAQEYILGNMYMGLETSDALAEYYAIQDILDGDMLSPDEYAKKIGQVTPRDIKKVAREIMRDSKLNIAVVGNIVDEKSLEKIFHF